MVDTFEHYDGTIGGEYGLINPLEDKNYPSNPEKDLEYSAIDPETSLRALIRYHDERAKHQDFLKKTSRGRMLVMMFRKRWIGRGSRDCRQIYIINLSEECRSIPKTSSLHMP